MALKAERTRSEITVFRRKSPPILNQTIVRKIVEDVLNDRKTRGAGLSILFTNNEEIEKFNRKFRGVDRPTDVIAFPFQGLPVPGVRYLGDIVISTEEAVLQALEQGHSPEEEVGILIIHGVLHLLGYDHERDTGRMRRLEHRLREKILKAPGFLPKGRKSRKRAVGKKPAGKKAVRKKAKAKKPVRKKTARKKAKAKKPVRKKAVRTKAKVRKTARKQASRKRARRSRR